MYGIFIDTEKRRVVKVEIPLDVSPFQYLLKCKNIQVYQLDNNNALVIEQDPIMGDSRDFFKLKGREPFKGNGVIVGIDGKECNEGRDTTKTVEMVERSLRWLTGENIDELLSQRMIATV